MNESHQRPVGYVSQDFLDGKWSLDHIAKTDTGQISRVIPVFTRAQPSAEPVATINDAGFSLEDARRVMALPPGTKLYAHPPTDSAALRDAERLDSGCIMTHERDEFGEEYRCERRGLDLRTLIDEAIAEQESLND